MRNVILSSTALAVSLSLTAPVRAQGVPECGEGGGVPCQLPDGSKIVPPMASALPECVEAPEETDAARYMCVSGEDVLVDWEALTSPDAPPAVVGVLTDLINGAIPKDGVEAAVALAVAMEATSEENAAPETAEAEPVTEEAAPETAEAEPVTEEAAPETAEAEPVTEEAAPETAEAETVTEEAAPETVEAETVTETVEAEATPETVEAEAETETVEAEAAPETPVAEPQSAEDILKQLAERQEKIIERLNREAEEAEASAAAAAAAATEDTAATEADADVVVEEEVVTEADARGSDEEFATAVGTASAAATATATPEDEGLSKFEKALLLGLGAIAVGQILDNGDEIVANTGDRVVVRRDGELFVLKDDDALLRQPGSEVRTERFADGSTREIVTREDGVQIVTVKAADGRVLRRAKVLPDGTRVLLFDDTQRAEPVQLEDLPQQEARTIIVDTTDEDELRRALEAATADDIGRRFSLRQVRDIREVRELAPELKVEAVTFETGSAVIRPDQARELARLGRTLNRMIEERPGEVFLVEGHTDATGGADYNLALSDRRAESLALALSEYFDVPPENMIVQGYGETELKVPTPLAERENRRAVVRRITPLLRTDLVSNF